MDRDSIKALLKDVFGPNVKTIDHQRWVSLHCPLAPWTHAGGKDTRPSAGISVKPDDISIFHCQACLRSYPLGKFFKELAEYTGEDYSDLIGEGLKDEYFGGNLRPWGERPEEDAAQLPDPLDEATYLDLYDPAYEHWYVQQRGICSEAAQALDLRLDPSDSKGAERILFPVYSHRGGFYGFSGRATDPSVYPPIRDYHGLPKQFLLLGSHLLPKDAAYLILVEGLFDMAMLFQYGYPVVAYMGGFPTDHQIEAIIDIGLPVYFIPDNPQQDAAGQEALSKMRESILCKHVPVMKVRYPERRVRDKEGNLRHVNDPDELTEGEVDYMLRSARLL